MNLYQLKPLVQLSDYDVIPPLSLTSLLSYTCRHLYEVPSLRDAACLGHLFSFQVNSLPGLSNSLSLDFFFNFFLVFLKTLQIINVFLVTELNMVEPVHCQTLQNAVM